MPRLGKGLIPEKDIKEDRIAALYDILDEYRKIIHQHNAEKILLTATNAFRIASAGRSGIPRRFIQTQSVNSLGRITWRSARLLFPAAAVGGRCQDF